MKPGLTCYDSSVQQRITQKVSGDHPFSTYTTISEISIPTFPYSPQTYTFKDFQLLQILQIIVDIHPPPKFNIYFVLPNEITRTVNGPNA